MRESKFRGKDTASSKWIYGSLFSFTGNINQGQCYISDYGSMVDHSLTEDRNDAAIGFFRRVEAETVGEFTGLKDKNGKEIYEGDLVDWNGLYEIRFGEHDVPSVEDEVVIDHATGFYFKAQHDLKDIEPFGFDIPMNKGYAEDCKIIGNIHEHPHLLEVDSNA